MKTEFTKEHTLVAKGIAILMMLYHHLFIIPDRISCEYMSLVDKIIPNFQATTASFCKLCVCIYVFLTGYGMWISLNKEKNIFLSYKNVLFRIVKFMTTFVVIFMLFVPAGMVTGYFEFNIKYLFGSIFGLGIGTYNNTWWFVNAYIVLLLLSPVFVYVFTNAKWYKKIAVASVIPVIYFLGRLIIKYIGTNIVLDHYFWQLENIPLILTLFMGILCARFNVYTKTMSLFRNLENPKKQKCILNIVSLLIMIGSIVFRICFTRNTITMRYDFIVAPLFVFSTTTLIVNSKTKNTFILLGNHSTNMWLSHAFLCYTYFQWLVFLPYYSEIVFIWFVILSLFCSYLINVILVPMNNLIFSKAHRLTYKGYFIFLKK